MGEGRTNDWYGGSGQVSFERAAEEEIGNKKALDDAVEDENRYSSDEGRKFRGLPPCQERKRRWWG